MIRLFLLCLLNASIAQAFEKAVTYDVPGGRFGDQLIAYIHAKWISYRYDIPLLYKPFSYSTDLVLDEKEERYDPFLVQTFEHRIAIEDNKTVEENSASSVLFLSQYFPESPFEMRQAKWASFSIDWSDEGFISHLRTLICPKQLIASPALPTDRVSVALHVRRGGGFDTLESQYHWPHKFPSDDFYIEELRRVYELKGHQPLFVHIFTDDLFPQAIAEKYRHALEDIDIVFDYRSEGNSHNSYVLADFFDMMRYECLIRPDSNYSILAEKLGAAHIIIHPLDCRVEEKKIVIPRSEVIYRKNYKPGME